MPIDISLDLFSICKEKCAAHSFAIILEKGFLKGSKFFLADLMPLPGKSKDIASKKFVFPDPFGPTKTTCFSEKLISISL